MNKVNILNINDLKVRFFSNEGTAKAVNGINFHMCEGESVGIVGESGCGKSVTAFSILRILPSGGRITSGSINYRKHDGTNVDLCSLDSESNEIRKIRGREISMIFQEPMTAFSPVHTIGNQICEAILLHQKISREESRKKAVEILDKVGISDPEQRIDEYPFQFSGGMRQRAMIAMALVCNPRILIADEPTTALDVTIQAQVLKLIKKIQGDFNTSLILITHDLGVIAQMVEYVNVMYLGGIVEEGSVAEIFDNPLHPYTRDLLKSIPQVTGVEGKLSSIKGSVPSAYSLPQGCPFHTRCQEIMSNICNKKKPTIKSINGNHRVSCFLYFNEEMKDIV